MNGIRYLPFIDIPCPVADDKDRGGLLILGSWDIFMAFAVDSLMREMAEPVSHNALYGTLFNSILVSGRHGLSLLVVVRERRGEAIPFSFSSLNGEY